MKRMDNLEKLLSSEDTNNSVIEIDNFINNLCSYGDRLDKLTEPQKQFYYNQCLEREVNNGGFNQYFVSPSGEFAHQTLHSLIDIGAETTAGILQKAIEQFPNKKVPTDRDERIDLVEEIEEVANEVWENLDEKFFEYADDLNTLNLDFVKKHKSYF
ncbi:DMP19 family protein [Riemerella anatipestifer]|uniref:DMP19 family protein n=1 Tax=Riemerella anatipestifer TaxID=34085 RepID=UPI00129E9E5D|nr:DMP19 family protein [Riemerella anatipestifer]MRM82662.1 DUF4375 domain-containing protein [Riemerella anatipestifer]